MVVSDVEALWQSLFLRDQRRANRGTGTVTFDAGPADQTGWGGISSESSPDAITVPAVRIDERLRYVDIAVLKIDGEGADTLVLRGCEGLLKDRRIQTIYFEQHPLRMERLGSVGYDCRSLGADAKEWIGWPRKP